MGDESQRDYEQYMATLPKAEVIWLHSCVNCGGAGKLVAINDNDATEFEFACRCVLDFNCPQCGKKHGRPFFAGTHERLRHCYVCGWSEK